MIDKFYKKVIDSAEQGYALIELTYNTDTSISDSSFIFNNPVFEKIIEHNCDLKIIISKHLHDLDFKFSNNKVKRFEWMCGPSSLNYTIELSFLDNDHVIVTTNHSIFKENLNHKDYTSFLSSSINKTKCKLEKNEQKYKLLFESMYESFALHEIILDSYGKPIDYIFLDVNTAFEESTGLKREEVLGKKVSQILIGTSDVDDMFWIEDFGRVALTGERFSFEFQAKEIDKIFQIKAFSPEKNIFAVTFVDITNLRQLEKNLKEEMEKIEYLSYCDQLTNLYNRRFFEQTITKIDSAENLPLSIIMADINGLKLVNDAFGHSMGDQLLIEVSNILKTPLSENKIVARIGGDEFAVILPKTDSSEAKHFVNELKSLSNRSQLYPIKVSMALGWDTKYDIHENIDSILKKAEDYMYRNKLMDSQSVKSKTIETVIESLYQKDMLEQEHSKRVGQMCEDFAKVLGLDHTEVEQVKLLGVLHDIGKIAIDNKILEKPSKLTSYEFKEIERHSEIGYNILSSVNDMSQVANYVLSHHENFDGTGYPKNLKGHAIPLPSRIIKIIDAFDAMTQDRPYRKSMSEDEAIAELNACAGTQFDPNLVEIFIKKVIK